MGSGELAGFDLGTGTRTSFHADVTGGNFPTWPRWLWRATPSTSGETSSRSNGIGRLRAAALDAATGDVRSWNPRVGGTDEYDPAPLTLSWWRRPRVLGRERVYRVGGVPRIQLAAVDAITGALSEWNPSPKGYVNALAGAGALLFVGGDFDRIAGTPRSALAWFETTSGALRPWDPSPTSSGDDLLSVESLAIVDSTVYVGGYFTSIAGAKRNGLAAVDAETGSLDDWDPVPTPAGVLSASQTTIAAAEDDRVTVFVRGVGPTDASDSNEVPRLTPVVCYRLVVFASARAANADGRAISSRSDRTYAPEPLHRQHGRERPATHTSRAPRVAVGRRTDRGLPTRMTGWRTARRSPGRERASKTHRLRCRYIRLVVRVVTRWSRAVAYAARWNLRHGGGDA